MPWSRTDPAKDRLELVLEWEGRWQAGRVNLSELCRELGISRETAYAWLRRYPRPLERFEDHSDDRLRVDRHGYLRWERPRVFISTALAHEDVFVDPELDAHGQRWEIRWGDVLLGWIDERRLDRGLLLPSRRRR